MVKLKYSGEGETFFDYKGKRFTSVEQEIEVDDLIAEYILSNPKWETIEKTKKKKTKEKKK
tara:strand:- start:297 stop:479 length:183 start_codon:yes stop_codon:yes gene_type:complete